MGILGSIITSVIEQKRRQRRIEHYKEIRNLKKEIKEAKKEGE